MVRWLREWWDGKTIQVNSDEPDIGGLGSPPRYITTQSESSKAAHKVFEWHAKNWDKFWTIAISVLSLLISCIALSRSG